MLGKFINFKSDFIIAESVNISQKVEKLMFVL